MDIVPSLSFPRCWGISVDIGFPSIQFLHIGNDSRALVLFECKHHDAGKALGCIDHWSVPSHVQHNELIYTEDIQRNCKENNQKPPLRHRYTLVASHTDTRICSHMNKNKPRYRCDIRVALDLSHKRLRTAHLYVEMREE